MYDAKREDTWQKIQISPQAWEQSSVKRHWSVRHTSTQDKRVVCYKMVTCPWMPDVGSGVMIISTSQVDKCLGKPWLWLLIGKGTMGMNQHCKASFLSSLFVKWVRFVTGPCGLWNRFCISINIYLYIKYLC